MSMDAYRWAMTWNDLTSPQKFVLVVIADHYNDKAHRSWPSIERIAAQTALNRTTVMRAIKALEEEHGLIQVEKWTRADHGTRLNQRYCLPAYDSKSIAAKHQPVLAHTEFDANGNLTYDTSPHRLAHGEAIPGYTP